MDSSDTRLSPKWRTSWSCNRVCGAPVRSQGHRDHQATVTPLRDDEQQDPRAEPDRRTIHRAVGVRPRVGGGRWGSAWDRNRSRREHAAASSTFPMSERSPRRVSRKGRRPRSRCPASRSISAWSSNSMSTVFIAVRGQQKAPGKPSPGARVDGTTQPLARSKRFEPAAAEAL